MRPLQQNTVSEFDEADLKDDRVILEKRVRGRSRISIQINVCGYCIHTYTFIYTTYRSHLSKKHHHTQSEHTENDSEVDDDHVGGGGEHYEEEACRTPSTSEHSRKRREALFILKVKEERKLTQTALNGLLMDIRGTGIIHNIICMHTHTYHY